MKLFVVLFLLVSVSWASPPHLAVVPKLDGRIVGGSPVSIDEYNYQVSLLWFGSHICGGFLISEQWVVSAAHCTDGISNIFLQVRAGSSNLNTGGDIISVDSVNDHPSYNASTNDYDITLLQLSSAVSLSSSIGVATLPTSDQQFTAGTLAVVTGWGTTSEGGSAATTLQAVSVPLVSNTECAAAYGSSLITDRMLCAGYTEGGRDACQGDSGGPLAINRVVIGVVSWGYGCARPNYPGVYASVPNLRNYISSVSGI